jgi:hypothetical protein
MNLQLLMKKRRIYVDVIVSVGGRYGIIFCSRFGPPAMGVWL